MLRVALLRDFDEARLFGVRFYAERVREAVADRCLVTDVHPRPRGARGPAIVHPLQTFVVKELLYPLSVRGLDVDVAHVVDQSHAHLVRRLEPPATVVTCHDLWSLRSPNPLRRFGYRRRVRALTLATRVIAVSEAARREALSLGVPAARIALVRNRVERYFCETPDDREIEVARRRFGVDPKGFVLHVGNNLPYKNLDASIRALAELGRADGSGLELVKVGADLTASQRRLAARENVRLRWIGEVAAAELRALYHLALCLVYPSLHEGFGWPIAEAIACGLPVVAGAVGAIPEIAGDAALLVDPTSPSAIAGAVARLRDDPSLREELAARSRGRRDFLACGDFGGELIDVYRAAAEEKRDA